MKKENVLAPLPLCSLPQSLPSGSADPRSAAYRALDTITLIVSSLGFACAVAFLATMG